VSWHSDEFPGWIEVSVRDARGQDHRIVDKVPALTLAHGVETVDGGRCLVLSPADVFQRGC
jgi:hypothetical protein